MIMGVEIDLNWSSMLCTKENVIKKNNENENKKRANYEHQVGDHMKTMRRKNSRLHPTKLSKPNEGPYEITEVLDSTVKIQRGGIR